MSSLWTDTVWEDPDGGRVIVHGTMPTVVYPNAMRPRATWHGLALLESPDVVDLWIQEEADEAESQGINLTHALLSGGAFGKYIGCLLFALHIQRTRRKELLMLY